MIDYNSLKNSTNANNVLLGNLIQKMNELNLSNADFKLLINEFLQDVRINGALDAYSSMIQFLNQKTN